MKRRKIRYNLFKAYFIKNHNSIDEECKLFFKKNLKDIFIVSDEINNEIKRCIFSVNYAKSSYDYIIFNLENLKDDTKDKIIYI